MLVLGLKDGTFFCYCAYVLGISGYSGYLRNLPTKTTIFWRGLCIQYVEKADLSRGYQNPKRKSGVSMPFSKIIELNFGKKLPYLLCILTLLIISEKCMVTHIFLSGFQ